MFINRLDHLVLTVRDIEKTVDFYKMLGFKEITFGNFRKALKFGNQKINLHQVGKEFEPKASAPTPGSADLCFIVSNPIEEIKQILIEKKIPIIKGIVNRTGAFGAIRSIYIRDLDENLIELSSYPKEY
ncbi:VOC family protein [Flavobacteriaceae bacterium R38]|nr:VOC family protein [Flavobacteriaceae bacterium R38]